MNTPQQPTTAVPGEEELREAVGNVMEKYAMATLEDTERDFDASVETLLQLFQQQLETRLAVAALDARDDERTKAFTGKGTYEEYKTRIYELQAERLRLSGGK